MQPWPGSVDIQVDLQGKQVEVSKFGPRCSKKKQSTVVDTFSKFSLNIRFLFFICCLDGDFNRFRMSHGTTVLKKRKNQCKTHELLTSVTDSHLEHTWNAMTTMTTKLDVSGGARSRRAGDDFWKNTGHCESPAIYAVKTRDL